MVRWRKGTPHIGMGDAGSSPVLTTKNKGDATVVRFRSREDKKPKHADELAWPLSQVAKLVNAR